LRAGGRTATVLRLRDGLYLADPADSETATDYFLNHSCDPNIWLIDDITLAARRTIAAGEELTADYATWECDPDWVLEPCRCGSTLCRGRITGDDWLLRELQTRYGSRFSSYLMDLMSRR
jgi:hypothetical protein